MSGYGLIDVLAARKGTKFRDYSGIKVYWNFDKGNAPGRPVYVEVEARTISGREYAVFRFIEIEPLEMLFHALAQAAIHGRKNDVIATEVHLSINFSDCEAAEMAFAFNCEVVSSDEDLGERLRLIREIAAITSVLMSCEMADLLYAVNDGKRYYGSVLGDNLETAR